MRLKAAAASADFRPDINALRALAVLAVVAYHYGVPYAGGGFAGVDVFFVISGFLIGSHILAAHARSQFSFAAFFQARLRRIFPALAVMCLACLLWGWWFVLPYDYLKSTRHVMAALFFLSNLAFTGEQGYFD
ncbi:acyltransferase, partial [Rhodoferax sp.]|uniref:acyltransferase family protein n=1 Tax=Rhodoferax sp. TaxID=50421 RepID=UPI00261B8E11